MNLEDLKGRKICLLGLGLENFSLAQYLAKKGMRATILDKRVESELGDRYKKLKAFNFLCGPNYLKYIKDFDVIFKTPGFAGKLKIKKNAIIITAMNLFFDLCPAKIIAITGTKGKGTVASLCHHVLIRGNKKSWLAGNIGKAPFDFIDQLKPEHFVVLELSSFQLLGFRKKPHIAVVTNLFPEHLSPADPINPIYHKSLKEYYDAKANIFLNQEKDDWLIINKNNHHPDKILRKSKARKIYFDSNFCGRKSWNIRYLIGRHNQENIAAFCAVAKILKIPQKIISEAVDDFQGIEHHLEFVKEINSVKFYNDSASTMPMATLAAAKAFNEDIILIIGGMNKGYDLKKFAKQLLQLWQPIIIVLIGETAEELEQHLSKRKAAFAVYKIDGKMKEIVKRIFALASELPGKTPIVFSPGFASFDMFKNSKDRGEKFKKAVLSLSG